MAFGFIPNGDDFVPGENIGFKKLIKVMSFGYIFILKKGSYLEHFYKS